MKKSFISPWSPPSVIRKKSKRPPLLSSTSELFVAYALVRGVHFRNELEVLVSQGRSFLEVIHNEFLPDYYVWIMSGAYPDILTDSAYKDVVGILHNLDGSDFSFDSFAKDWLNPPHDNLEELLKTRADVERAYGMCRHIFQFREADLMKPPPHPIDFDWLERATNEIFFGGPKPDPTFIAHISSGEQMEWEVELKKRGHDFFPSLQKAFSLQTQEKLMMQTPLLKAELINTPQPFFLMYDFERYRLLKFEGQATITLQGPYGALFSQPDDAFPPYFSSFDAGYFVPSTECMKLGNMLVESGCPFLRLGPTLPFSLGAFLTLLNNCRESWGPLLPSNSMVDLVSTVTHIFTVWKPFWTISDVYGVVFPGVKLFQAPTAKDLRDIFGFIVNRMAFTLDFQFFPASENKRPLIKTKFFLMDSDHPGRIQGFDAENEDPDLADNTFKKAVLLEAKKEEERIKGMGGDISGFDWEHRHIVISFGPRITLRQDAPETWIEGGKYIHFEDVHPFWDK